MNAQAPLIRIGKEMVMRRGLHIFPLQGFFSLSGFIQLQRWHDELVRHQAPSRIARPQSYEELTRQAHARSAGLVLQPSGSNGGAFLVPPRLSSFRRDNGQPLPPTVRQKMESLFKADLSGVQVHVGPEAPALGALAFTQGTSVYFAPGQYNPHTPLGLQLLGHELTHVMQQRAGRVRNPFGARLAVVQDRALEAEADHMGRLASTHQVPSSFAMPALQRQLAPNAVQLRADSVAPPAPVSRPTKVAPGSYRIVAGAPAQPSGTVSLHSRGRSMVEVTDLGVAPAHRGRGLGQTLLLSALQAASRLGKRRVRLTSADNGTGRLTSWYKQMGFEPVGAPRRDGVPLEAPIKRVLKGIVQAKMPPGVDRFTAGFAALGSPSKRFGSSVLQRAPAAAAAGAAAAVAAPAVVVAAPPPAPVLARINQRAPSPDGVCGNFSFEEDWQVTNPGANGGVIVQHIVRNFHVFAVSAGRRGRRPRRGVLLTAARLAAAYQDAANPLNVNELNYWEMWPVSAAGVVTNNGDEFAMSSITRDGNVDRNRNTTVGWYSITGTATYYPTTTQVPATLGFAGGVANAGLLSSSTADPTATVTGLITGGEAASAAVVRTVRVDWDSTVMTRPPGVMRGGTYGLNQYTVT
ncbi:GNAT family N-acetyltransferase [Microbacteriaceae bacterium K1510]|nr:GNAT family N-acetyltransferase [Microbacteriaceae bacterium K1510]